MGERGRGDRGEMEGDGGGRKEKIGSGPDQVRGEINAPGTG